MGINKNSLPMNIKKIGRSIKQNNGEYMYYTFTIHMFNILEKMNLENLDDRFYINLNMFEDNMNEYIRRRRVSTKS